MSRRTSGEGGVGRSAGRWGKRVGIRVGWEVKRGARLAGVRTSVKESSGNTSEVRLWSIKSTLGRV